MDKSDNSLELSLPVKHVLDQISKRIRTGEILSAAVHHFSKASTTEYRLDDIKSTFNEWLDHTEEALKMISDSPGILKGFLRPTLDDVSEDEQLNTIMRNMRENINLLKMLNQKIEVQPEFSENSTERIVPDTKEVFIIHGHDDANRMRLQEMLENEFELKAHLMIKEAGKGRTLIEKFEEEAQLASYAFALLTPDDLVKVKNTESEYAQARPNAIFELGWFYGRLGRRHIAILFKKGTHLHSDLAGISRIEFSDSVDECFIEIKKELKEASIISE